MHVLRAALAVAVVLSTAAAVDPACYALVGAPSLANPKSAPVTCDATTPRGRDICFLLCGLCTTPDLMIGMAPEAVRAGGACTACVYRCTLGGQRSIGLDMRGRGRHLGFSRCSVLRIVDVELPLSSIHWVAAPHDRACASLAYHPQQVSQYCTGAVPDADTVAAVVTSAVTNASMLHGCGGVIVDGALSANSR